MNDRLVTVASFDVAYKAELAKDALEEVGIAAVVNDSETAYLNLLQMNSTAGAQLLVAEEDAERALAVIEPFTRPGAMTSPVSDEELARQAMAAPTEEEERAALALETQGTAPAQVDPDSHRDRHAARAFWCLLGGVICLPAWAVGMYSLLTATLSSGPLSTNSRFSLKVAWVLGALTTTAIILVMARTLTYRVP